MSWLWDVIIGPCITIAGKWVGSLFVHSIQDKIKPKIDKTVETVMGKVPSVLKSDAKSTRPKLPTEFVQCTAGTMEIGQKEVFHTRAMKKDTDGDYWINPESVPIGVPAGDWHLKMTGEPILQLERTSEGFKADIRSALGERWGSKPKDKLAGWIPVVEFITEQPPR